MYDIYYIGAQNSEKIDFCQWPYMVTGGDVFDDGNVTIWAYGSGFVSAHLLYVMIDCRSD